MNEELEIRIWFPTTEKGGVSIILNEELFTAVERGRLLNIERGVRDERREESQWSILNTSYLIPHSLIDKSF